MAEWIYEAGIGENRAALVEAGEIIEAQIELPGQVRPGSVVPAALVQILVPRVRGLVRLADGTDAILEPLPPQLTEGAAIRVEIVREAIPERGRPKLAKCRHSQAEPGEGPSLLQRLRASGAAVAVLGFHEPDRLEAAGWFELIEQAAGGDMSFAGGGLRMSVTPAMTLFDVDGALPAADLAKAGAAAAGRAIRRFGIGGSIGIDLPTLSSRDDRQAAARALDDALPQPFERTAVNGFGFLQVVRKRERPSIPEIVQADPVGIAARLLLRTAARSTGSGPRTIRAAPAIVAAIRRRPDWIEAASRAAGAPFLLQDDAALSLWGGHVHVERQG